MKCIKCGADCCGSICPYYIIADIEAFVDEAEGAVKSRSHAKREAAFNILIDKYPLCGGTEFRAPSGSIDVNHFADGGDEYQCEKCHKYGGPATICDAGWYGDKTALMTRLEEIYEYDLDFDPRAANLIASGIFHIKNKYSEICGGTEFKYVGESPHSESDGESDGYLSDSDESDIDANMNRIAPVWCR